MLSPPTLHFPAALVRFWPQHSGQGDGGGDDREALEIAAALAAVPGFAKIAERLFTVLPVDGRLSVFDLAVRWSMELQNRLLSAGLEERISGILVFPGGVVQHGDEVSPAVDFLLQDLEERAPELAAGAVFATGYAARWLRGRYRFEPAAIYNGSSGRRVPLFQLIGEEAEHRPWHNPEVLGRRVVVERPGVEAALDQASRQGAFRVRGALGVGKSHAVWHFLKKRRQTGEPVIWVGVGRALPGTAVLAGRLVADIARLVGSGDVAEAALANPAAATAAVVAGLERVTADLSPPWVVCDDFQTITERDLEVLGHLLAHPRFSEVCRLILIARTGRDDPPSVSHLPLVEIPPMNEEESARHRSKLLDGLGMDDEIVAYWSQVAAGNPLILEEGLVGLVHCGRIRRVYGSFFFESGGEVAYEPSQRWMRQVEAEGRRLGELLSLRILAAGERDAPASHLELATAEFDLELDADWQRPYLAAGWLREVDSPWGPSLAFASPAYSSALIKTVAADSVASLRRALGKVVAADSRTPSGDWHAYQLLAGSPEALPALLDFSRESDDRLSREELFEALLSEYRVHRERGGDAATELDLLWSLLPVSQHLGRLKELAQELERAIQLAADRPRRFVALLALQAELEQEKGRFREAEALLRRALAASEGIDETRRAAIFIRLGDLLMRKQRLREAKELFESLLGVVERAGRSALVATCHFHLGNVALRQKRLQYALQHHEEACRIRRQRQSAHQLGASLSALGAVHLALGDYPRALALYREAEEVIDPGGDGGDLAFAQRGAGRALSLLGDHLAATKPLRRALAARQDRDLVGEALVRLDLAANQLDLGNVEQALAEARHAHFRLSLTSETSLIGDAEQVLGRILRGRNQDAAARRHFIEARRLHLEHDDRQAAAVDCSWLLEIAIEADDRQDVITYSAEMEELLADVPYPASGEMIFFRLYRACEWLRGHQIPAPQPGERLRRAYRELLRKTSFLSPERRHTFLYQIREHQELLDAAARQNLSFPGV